ncbi:competence protein CoiA [Limosilactobacillus caecicola]|uniref:competence protein CoiA n=1 Tax=Limosilactobacillus caecicola TaxID=2941332 RepID=UPI00203D5DC3|nr:competence protein CoiA family protein [Limosilactobacillus caecicola]
MKIAVNESGQLVNAHNLQTGEKYYCPQCHAQMIVRTRGGKNFFAHYQTLSNLHGQTDEHLIGKRQIFQWARQNGWAPQMEPYLSDIKQRPDILITVSHQLIALEFQCSPLTLQQIRSRNNGYRSLGIGVIWFLGSPYRRRLQSAKIAEFTQNYHGKPVLYFWNVMQNQLEKMSLYQCSFNSQRFTQQERLIKQTIRLFRERNSQRELTELAYQHGHVASCCPLFVHDIIPRWPVMQRPVIEWRIRTLLVLEDFPLGTIVSQQQWEQMLINQAKWLEMPCLSSQNVQKLRDLLVFDWQQQLILVSIIKLQANGVKYLQQPKWFRTVDEKINYICRSSKSNGQI